MQFNILKKVKAVALMLSAFALIAVFSAASAEAQSRSQGFDFPDSSYTAPADSTRVAVPLPPVTSQQNTLQNTRPSVRSIMNDGAQLRDKYGDVMTDDKGNPLSARRLQKMVDDKVDDSQNSAAFKPKTVGEYFSKAFQEDVQEWKDRREYYQENDVGLLRQAGDMAVMGLEKGQKAYNAYFDAVDNMLSNESLNALADKGWLGKAVATVATPVAKYVARPLAKVSRFIGNLGFGIAKTVTSAALPTSNFRCRQERMDAIYKSGCYPCKVIKSLLSAFINGVNVLENVMVYAGKRILLLGFMLWVVFYILQQLSSLKNLEPAAMINDLLIMAFKVLGAWIIISVGFAVFVDFVVTPFLNWGTDFGTYILTSTSNATGLDISGNQVPEAYMLTEAPKTVTGKSYIQPKMLNNLMTYVAAVDGTVTSHMKLGHMITCHAQNMGQWVVLGFKVNNILTWICGALIWFMGFMITFAILFYLIDITFKIGFSIIAFPIAMALWPFSITTDKLKAIVNMIINAAGLFIFLAITVSVGLVLVDSALSIDDLLSNSNEAVGKGIIAMFEAIERGDNEYVSDHFSLFSTAFLVLIFAYLYAFKSISSTNEDYVKQFFPDSVLGDQRPMHQMLVGAVDFTTSKIKQGAKFGKDIIKHQTSLAMGKLLNSEDAKEARKKFIEKIKSIPERINRTTDGKYDEALQKEEDKSTADTVKGMTNMEGKDTKKALDQQKGKPENDSGGDLDTAAKTMESAGESTTEAGKAIKKATDAAAEGQRGIGEAAATEGTAIAVGTWGIGSGAAVAGHGANVGLQASAAATQAAGAAAGTALEVIGKILKKMGKIMKRIGKVTKRAKKVAQKVQKATQKVSQKIEKAASSNSDNNNENGENGNNNNNSKNNNQNKGQSGGNPSGKNEDDGLTIVSKSMADGATGGSKKK